jgi:small subunit ribosomal protein S17
MATTKRGIVTKSGSTSTVTVTVHRSMTHPVYRKRYRQSTNLLVDLGDHDARIGDEVMISECRPLSKRKHFRITEILKKAPRVSDIKEEEDIEKVIHREKEAPPLPKETAHNESVHDEETDDSATDTDEESSSEVSTPVDISPDKE